MYFNGGGPSLLLAAERTIFEIELGNSSSFYTLSIARFGQKYKKHSLVLFHKNESKKFVISTKKFLGHT